MNRNTWKLLGASSELMFAAALWGFGFIAVVWALPVWGPLQLMFWRFLLGAAAGLVISAIRRRPDRTEFAWLAGTSFLPAFLLFVMSYLQTAGLKYTTATKSGFITVLYVVLVPLIESGFRRRKIGAPLWICVGLSLAGVYMIVDPNWETGWNRGDVMTLACAVAAALQIIALDRVSGTIDKAFLFNSLQSFWVFVMTAMIVPFQGGTLIPSAVPSGQAIAGLLMLGLGSTLIAFYLQVKAQKVLSPTVSSLFFLLESPFALVFAVLLLGEKLSAFQTAGAALILTSAALATIQDYRKPKNNVTIASRTQ